MRRIGAGCSAYLSVASQISDDDDPVSKEIHRLSWLIWQPVVFGIAARVHCSTVRICCKRRTALETYLRDVVQASFPILPYDEAAAAWHGRERARLEALGRTAPYVDGQIVGIAHAHGLVLVTANVKDFAPFQELDVENW
jgi:predicted nucleic acid-binding protein